MNSIDYFNLIHKKYKKNISINNIIKGLNNHKQFIFIKYGDGEVECMKNSNNNRGNCDNDIYFPELSNDLKSAFIYFVEHNIENNVYIGKWHYENEIKYLCNYYYENGKRDKLISFVDYHLIMNDKEHLNNNEMYELVKCIKMKNDYIKIVISNENNILLKELFSTLYFIETPKSCTYLVLNEILNNIEKIINEHENKNILLITSCGLSAKVIIYKILEKYGIKISALDFGSSFDLLCKKSITRSHQNEYTYENIYNYYEDLL